MGYSPCDRRDIPMWERSASIYDRGIERAQERGDKLTRNGKWQWARETINYQVFTQARTAKWNGVLYLPNDILRVGRPFGEIEVIHGVAQPPHTCNCPHCGKRDV